VFGGEKLASNNIETKVEKLLENIITNLGYDLYDVIYEKEGKDYYLRIVIDKPEGIDINDCEKVNNEINDILDEADYIKDQYFLEVSSPGLERTLRKEKHFLSQIGNEISVKLFKPINKQKELKGTLEEYNNNELTIKVGETTIKIDLKDIAIVKTIFNW
jgi:ribosome maturation factor RimP